MKGGYMEPKQENTAHQLRVMEFMRRAGQDVPVRPTVPTAETRRLRAKLILEEALETVEALAIGVKIGGKLIRLREIEFLAQPDHLVSLEAVADGCADLSVVNTGTLVACGLPDEPILRTVDESNLTKFDPPRCPDCDANMCLTDEGVWECTVDYDHRTRPLEDGPYRRDDGKWIKPPYWKKPSFLGAIKGDK